MNYTILARRSFVNKCGGVPVGGVCPLVIAFGGIFGGTMKSFIWVNAAPEHAAAECIRCARSASATVLFVDWDRLRYSPGANVDAEAVWA